MVSAYKKPGVVLIFDDEIWYIPTADFAQVRMKVDEIKDVLVGTKGAFSSQAQKLDPKDYISLSDVAAEDIKALLSTGITIRPMGR